MIVLDTSALMAVALKEAKAEDCKALLEGDSQLVISAGTLTEVLIVAERRGFREAVARLIEGLGVEVVPVTSASARRAADAYSRWGRGVHPAGLNYGDCFAYEVAKDRSCPLLYVGDDFSLTDITSAI